MKHLTKFLEYIKENKDIDLDLIINDFLVPIKHLGVKIEDYKSIVTSGEFSGNNRTILSFNIDHFDRVDGADNTHFKDKKVWELLDELIMFKNVMDETYGNPVTIWFSPDKIVIDIYSKVEEDDKYLIEQLYNKLRDGYSSKVYFDIPSGKEDTLKVFVEGTKIVWENYIRQNSIDLSKFNLEFIDNPTEIRVKQGYGSYNKKVKHVNIIITVKK